MPELGQRDFSAGWVADADPINGNSKGLLRMDNVHLDEKGSLTLIRGANKVSPLQSTVIGRIYSKVLNGVKHRYIYTLNGTVKKDVNEAETFPTTVLSGGELVRTGFGAALGHVLITSGSLKKKDDGSTISNLGVTAPGAPTLVLNTVSFAFVDGGHTGWGVPVGTAVEGTLGTQSGSNVEGTTDATSGRFIMKHVSSQDGSFSGDVKETDVFTATVNFADSATIVKFRIEVYLASGPGDASGQDKDFFFIEWTPADIPNNFSSGSPVWSTLKTKRKLNDMLRNTELPHRTLVLRCNPNSNLSYR